MTTRERREARAARRRAWAESRDQKARAATARAHELGQERPLGQPILVGHHSEASARRHLDRVQSATRQAIDHDAMAAHHDRAAGAIERELDRSIYSDDEDAGERLQERIDEREAKRDRIKRYNASVRRGAMDAGILTRDEQAELIKLLRVSSNHAGDGTWPRYILTNLTAAIRRDRQRLEQPR